MQVRGHELPVLISVDNSDLCGSVILAKIEKKGWKDGSALVLHPMFAPGKIHLPLVSILKKKSFFPFIAKRALPYLYLSGALLGQEEESFG